MLSLRLFIVVVALLQLIVKSEAACVCNEPGVDNCAACNERTIIRPKQKSYEPYVDLPPIGDTCWCNKMLIEPAALPKPCEKHNKPNCKCKQEKNYNYEKSYDNPAYGNYDSSVYNNPPINYYSPPAPPKYNSPPADPVSVSLAIQAGKAIGVPEAKLAFGFVQNPIDGLQKIQFSNVPEENLFKLKSEVITLKKRPEPKKKYEEEIIVEEEEEEDDGSAYSGEKPHLTYKQLGYETEEFKNPKFRKVSSSAYAYPEEKSYDYKPVYGKTKVDCGFKPGRVTSYGKDCKNTDAYEHHY